MIVPPHLHFFSSNANGQSNIIITASDSLGSDTEQFTLTVTEVNDVPVANASSFSTNEDNEGSTTLTGSDGDLGAVLRTIRRPLP